MCGIDLGMERQLRFLQEIVPLYNQECGFPETRNGIAAYHRNNGYFEVVDADIAYCMVRHFQPTRIIEIGSGYSTLLFQAALKKNAETGGRAGELLAIDHDGHKFDAMAESEFASVMVKPVQEVDWSIFSRLGENDILFLDSSHVVGVGSDVVYEYLEILPRLNRGVLVHAHDIFLPADYPRQAVLNHLCFWSEQYLLQAFLMFNREFEVLWGSSAMQLLQREALEEPSEQAHELYRNAAGIAALCAVHRSATGVAIEFLVPKEVEHSFEPRALTNVSCCWVAITSTKSRQSPPMQKRMPARRFCRERRKQKEQSK
jgi:predicted O-methyltransferase YrrM